MERPWNVYVVACVIVTVLVFGRAYQWDRAIQAFGGDLQPKWSIATSEKTNQRFFLDNDPYYWITYARQMVQTGAW